MKRQDFFPRLMTIVNEETVAGTINPAEKEMNEVSDQPIEVAEETETTDNEGQTSVEPKADTAETSTKKKSSKKASETPLTQEQIDALKHETEVFEQEVARMLADSRYHAFQMPNGRVVMDLTAAHKDGIQIVRFDYNRTHGKDEDSTGKSLRADGAQHPLLVVPVKVANAAGLPVSLFQKDTDNSPVDEEGLAVVDGHGRINGAFGSKDEWPQFDAVLLVKNKDGYIDTKKAYSVTNEKISVWGAKDHLVPRLFDSNELRKETFKAIHELVAKDYLYTAACDWIRWVSGNVTKKELNAVVTEKEAKDFMKYAQYGKQIHEACVKKFGEGDDKLLKTKKFPETLIENWNSLRDKYGAEKATETMVEFIEQLESGKAIEITSAKKDKDKDLDKDTVRKQLVNKAYKEFLDKAKL